MISLKCCSDNPGVAVLLELLDLALQSCNFRLWHRSAVPIGGLELREIAGDALVDPLRLRFFTRDSRTRRPTIASWRSRPAIRSRPDKSDAGPAHRGAANPAIRRRERRAGKPPFLAWLFPELVGWNSEACSARLPLKRIGRLRDANPPYPLIEIILPRAKTPISPAINQTDCHAIGYASATDPKFLGTLESWLRDLPGLHQRGQFLARGIVDLGRRLDLGGAETPTGESQARFLKAVRETKNPGSNPGVLPCGINRPSSESDCRTDSAGRYTGPAGRRAAPRPGHRHSPARNR